MSRYLGFSLFILAIVFVSIFRLDTLKAGSPATETKTAQGPIDKAVDDNGLRMIREGRKTFRFDTFGDEVFWRDSLQFHEGIKCVTPRTALSVGLKVDRKALSPDMISAIQQNQVNLNDPAVTQLLLQANAVVGVKGFFSGGNLASIGIQCAFCHSTVDDSI